MAQDLDVAQLADPEGREGVEHGRDRAAPALPVRCRTSQNIARPVSGNVASQTRLWARSDAGAREAREADQRHEPEEMLRVGERPAVRVKHVGVEEPEGRRPERVHVPREDPRGEERIAQIDDRRAEARGRRPREDDRDRRQQEEDADALPHARAPSACEGRRVDGVPADPGPTCAPRCQSRARDTGRRQRRRASEPSTAPRRARDGAVSRAAVRAASGSTAGWRTRTADAGDRPAGSG